MTALRVTTHCPNLYQRMLALEETAFQEFAEFFGKRFEVLYRRYGLTCTEAEDLAVCSITNIALKIGMVRSVTAENFDSWVFTLARNALWDWRRTQRVSFVSIEELTLDISHERTQRSRSEPAAVQVVRDALAKLPEEDRLLVNLRYCEEPEPYEQISRRLGMTSSGARVRLHRAVRRLQRLIEDDPRSSSFLKTRGPDRYYSQKF
jgi:RNA polymerase sigma factor (sigma-70 family)